KRTPSPLDAPVTSATRPSRSNISAMLIPALDFGPRAEDTRTDDPLSSGTTPDDGTINARFPMADHDHEHDHSELSDAQLRVRALETVLTEKGYIDPAALDAVIETYERKVGPHVGARVVAKAWSDPAFKQALLEDASAAVRTLGHESRIGDHLVALENTPRQHNMVVCTLCSCYPWEVLGLPPVWYKSAPYRS